MAHAEAGEAFMLSSPQEVVAWAGVAVGGATELCQRLRAVLTASGTAALSPGPGRGRLCRRCLPPTPYTRTPTQVSRILYEVMKLPPPPCAKELKGGGYSTGQDVSCSSISANVAFRAVRATPPPQNRGEGLSCSRANTFRWRPWPTPLVHPLPVIACRPILSAPSYRLRCLSAPCCCLPPARCCWS